MSETASYGSFKACGNIHGHEVSQRLNLVVETPLSLSARGDLYGRFNIAFVCCHCAGSCSGLFTFAQTTWPKHYKYYYSFLIPDCKHNGIFFLERAPFERGVTSSKTH